MKIRKDMIFAVLTSFCMSALMFAVIPISSSLSYDPWADLRGPYSDPDIPDGKIDMRDIGYIANLFGTTGDPTKNVSITNWPTWWPSGDVNVTNWPSSLNVNVTNWQEGLGQTPSTFTRILKLKGFTYPAITPQGDSYTAWELFDENDAYPYQYDTEQRFYYGNTYDWTLGYNGTFVYEKYPQVPYKIQGNIRMNLDYQVWYNYSPFEGYCRGNLTLQKILPDGMKVALATMYSFNTTMGHKIQNKALVFTVSAPLTIEAGERLAVVFLIEFKWWAAGGNAYMGQTLDPTSNQFLINIPVVG